MAPKRGESIERTDEREEFMQKLSEYHEKRGTNLEAEPRVGVRHVDLFKLYNRVVAEGGYDLVSDTKAKPLMWRKLAEEFVGKNQYTAAQAFQIKNVYYKNLVAYEITTHWKQEPPPKEILEEVTAKGANVMTRTLENFVKPATRDQDLNGDVSDTSPEQKTPKEDKMDLAEEPGSGAGRTTRGLRQQPPQRQLFQPETSSGRQMRGHHGASHASPTPGAGAHTNGYGHAAALTNGASATLASYEPSQAYPLSLKPVVTPANNPTWYHNERKRKLDANAGPLAKKYRNIMLPGTGFIGPNIYVRAQLALQSGIKDEEQYALHHLVKISHERGDKYRFDQFPGLADALIKKILSVTSLFYDIDWDVMYDEEFFAGDDETLNGLDGTPDIIQRLKSRIPIISDDSVLGDDFLTQLDRMTEAALVTRNMCLQEENAAYLSRLPLIRDLIAVVLHMPQHSSIVELRHYVLDIAEQVLKYTDLSSHDALYQGLLRETLSSDRGAVVTALKTISRIAMTHPSPKRLDDVPSLVLKRVQGYLLVDDEELRSACLDFLMQYTSFRDNVENLLQATDAEALGRQLSRLVLFTAKEQKVQHKPKQPEAEPTAPPQVARLSKSVVEKLLTIEEPERSSEWLRMCFRADANAEMTQISLWQAYQGAFAPYQSTHPHLIAGEFIKNVSTTFHGATAQVAGGNKYVIKGIVSRKVPVDHGFLTGSGPWEKEEELRRCYWQMTTTFDGPRDPITGYSTGPITRDLECSEWLKGEDMLKHILTAHLQFPKKTRPSVSQPSQPDGDKMDVDTKEPTGTVAGAATDAPLPNGNAEKSKGSPWNSLTNELDFEAADQMSFKCRWANCERESTEFSGNKVSTSALFARHIETHLPDSDPTRTKHNVKAESTSLPPTTEETKLTMLEDESGDAAGVPLRAALVLRNLAKFMPKTVGNTNAPGAEKSGLEKADKSDPMTVVFDSEVRERLIYAMSFSKTIREYVASILRAVKKNGA